VEKTAVKLPWKSLRDSHFPHSPGDGLRVSICGNASSPESAIHPQISQTKQKKVAALLGNPIPKIHIGEENE